MVAKARQFSREINAKLIWRQFTLAPVMHNVDRHSAGLITKILRDWSAGDATAVDRLTDAVYSELRRLAGAVLGAQAGTKTLQPTELVHELYFHLPGVRAIDWKTRADFLSMAARIMRNILVDHARKRHAAKRGGTAVPLDHTPHATDPAFDVDVLVLHQALDRFAESYPRHARVVELRYFGGLTAEETSDVLRAAGETASTRTVDRDWMFAKAWLQDAIGSEQL